MRVYLGLGIIIGYTSIMRNFVMDYYPVKEENMKSREAKTNLYLCHLSGTKLTQMELIIVLGKLGVEF